MDIILKGLTAEQATELVNYFKHSLYSDSSVWIEEYCNDIDGIEVDSIVEKKDIIELNLITFEK